MPTSRYLASLGLEDRAELEQRLLARQSGRCFICDLPIDRVIHKGELDIDHIDPLLEHGLDAEQNFALTHASCNRAKGAANLEVARRLAEFERLQEQARNAGKRGANLGDVLDRHGGAKEQLRIQREGKVVAYALSKTGDETIRRTAVHRDKLSGMEYFFDVFPIDYIHHDDLINPRSIGGNVRGLIEEFLKRRPQLHVGLAWWAPIQEGTGPLKLFDGKHKAAAQILLGVRDLPLRVFIDPDLEVLTQTNTNAGGKLRQVAFDLAVMRHLGSTLYLDRVRQYQKMRDLPEDDYSFSEADLVRFFRGERREMERYIIDAQRDLITRHRQNRIVEFIEWAGKGADRPLAYSALDKTFFRELLFKQALETSIDEGLEQGSNPRQLERDQMARLMCVFADVFFVNKWDPEIGGRKLESRIQKGEKIPLDHLRAWRIAREEVLANVLRWVRLVVQNYFAWTGRVVKEDRLLHIRLPDELWDRLRNFLDNLARLPCWFDTNLSTTVFGPKQPRDFWEAVFQCGKAPNGLQILAQGLDLHQMITSPADPEVG